MVSLSSYKRCEGEGWQGGAESFVQRTEPDSEYPLAWGELTTTACEPLTDLTSSPSTQHESEARMRCRSHRDCGDPMLPPQLWTVAYNGEELPGSTWQGAASPQATVMGGMVTTSQRRWTAFKGGWRRPSAPVPLTPASSERLQGGLGANSLSQQPCPSRTLCYSCCSTRGWGFFFSQWFLRIIMVIFVSTKEYTHLPLWTISIKLNNSPKIVITLMRYLVFTKIISHCPLFFLRFAVEFKCAEHCRR